ncbi:HNH endonuclease [Ornithinimicrobium sp. F0845]|uniref:HNH endonuclease signature motif containing protein n=1 Tax=Ornithinimicrobium sp. F0845 TaxID=2926412 RepID=UPI001FF4BF64|nr:HNH endonuclease [Ornithinimicrobium sp. F0845]
MRSRIRKELADIDPDAVRQRAARARLERFVSTRASHLPGMTQWMAQLPAAESAQAWAAIDALAHQSKLDDPERSLDQCRADALLDLILGNATIKAALTLAVPVTGTATETDAGAEVPAGDAETGEGDLVPEAFGGPRAPDCTGPAGSAWEQYWPQLAPSDPDGVGVEVPGIGVIPVPLVLSMAADLGVSITRMLIDPETGTTVETRATGYRPPAGIARFVRLRDATCRFPNCSRRAERCDIDHVVPWPAGPTEARNLICLCRHHHRLKHATAWRAELLEDGRVIWTDPYGQQWVTYPRDHREVSAA